MKEIVPVSKGVYQQNMELSVDFHHPWFQIPPAFIEINQVCILIQSITYSSICEAYVLIFSINLQKSRIYTNWSLESFEFFCSCILALSCNKRDSPLAKVAREGQGANFPSKTLELFLTVCHRQYRHNRKFSTVDMPSLIYPAWSRHNLLGATVDRQLSVATTAL